MKARSNSQRLTLCSVCVCLSVCVCAVTTTLINQLSKSINFKNLFISPDQIKCVRCDFVWECEKKRSFTSSTPLRYYSVFSTIYILSLISFVAAIVCASILENFHRTHWAIHCENTRKMVARLHARRQTCTIICLFLVAVASADKIPPNSNINN